MTKSRIFLFLLLSFIAGVALRSFIFTPYTAIWLGGIAVVIGFAIGLSRQRREAWIAGLFLAAFLVGIFRYDAVERARPELSQWYGEAVNAEAVVWEAPVRDERVQRLKMRVIAIGGARPEQPFFILATVRRYPQYRIGDVLAVQGVIDRPENFSEFDYASYLARDNVFAVTAFPQVEKIGEGEGPYLAMLLSRVKDAFEANIDAALPEPHGAFLKGLTLGDRETLPQELIEGFRRTGTSHIVALSGYNITLIGRFFMTVLLAVTVPFQLTFWIATSAIILFVLLTGASASVVRAGIMGVLVLVAGKEGRMYQMRNALVFAAAAMIFHNPYVLRFDTGFQLSFLATLGLVYFSPHVARVLRLEKPLFHPEQKPQLLLSVRRTLIETLAAQPAVLPLLVYVFGQVSLVSPLVNILVLLAVPYAMVAGFITGGLGFLWEPLAYISGWVVWLLLEYQIRMIAFFAKIPAASVSLGAWVLIFMLPAYGLLLWRLFLVRGARK